jgi:hypothetical protein
MRSLQLTWLRLVVITLAGLALVLTPGMGMAQEAVNVQIDPVEGSGVSGTATLTVAGEGTDVALDITGLAPGTVAQATMQAGTCAMPSASFVALPELVADASGRAMATGSVLFRGAEPVALVTMADGEHIIAIQVEQVVACGVIPKPTSDSAPPAALPTTGRPAPWLAAIGIGLHGLGALSIGLFLRRPARPPRCL